MKKENKSCISKTYKSVAELFAEIDRENNKWYRKYFLLPLRWYFLDPVLFNPYGWLKMLPHNIKFRIKNKCPYKDTWSLDYSFYQWVYPRAKYVIKYSIDNHGLDKDIKKDYKRMLKILESLHNTEFAMATKKELSMHDEFMDLFKKYLFRLWI